MYPIPRQVRSLQQPHEPRRGSTFVVVLGLLALLALVGMSFVMFSGSEKVSAEIYAEAAHAEFASQFDTEQTLDYAIDQLILGSPDTYRNSAMWGGRNSLLAGLVGRDTQPHAGQGVHVDVHANGRYYVDQNYNQVSDTTDLQNLQAQGASIPAPVTNADLVEINDGPMAQGTAALAIARLGRLPSPDAGYTYPDCNNVFLAWRGTGLDSNNRMVNVVIPSFHRPQYLRTTRPILAWESRPETAKYVLRPHPLHQHIGPNGTSLGRRYVVSVAEARQLGLSGPFPFGFSEDLNGNGQLDPDEDANGNGRLDTEAHDGVWSLGPWQANSLYRVGQWIRAGSTYFRCVKAGRSGSSAPDWPSASAADPVLTESNISSGIPARWLWNGTVFEPRYEFDVDADGDGIREAVVLDLDHSTRVLPDGRKVIPLFGYTILDAGGLLNMNAVGNVLGRLKLEGLPRNLAGGYSLSDNPLGSIDPARNTTSFLSQSNQGVSPSEINPQWVLNAGAYSTDIPTGQSAEIFRNHVAFFGHEPADWIEAANQELWWALKGRPEFQAGTGDITNWLVGRSGNLPRLQSAVNTDAAVTADYPRPGSPGTDDNQDRFTGERNPPYTGGGARYRGFVHPIDFLGRGLVYVRSEDLNGDGALFLGEDFNNNGLLDVGEDQNGNGRLDLDEVDANANGLLDANEDFNNNNRWDFFEDFNGNGVLDQYWVPVFARPAGLQAANQLLRRNRWLRYFGFHGQPDLNSPFPRWANAVPRLAAPAYQQFESTGSLMRKSVTAALTDEEAETILDHRFRQSVESIFAPDENFVLQASHSDVATVVGASRLATLMPFNLLDSIRATEIRQKLTTESWDLDVFGKGTFLLDPLNPLNSNYIKTTPPIPQGNNQPPSHENLRPWEFAQQTTQQFPPLAGVYRPVVRNLMTLHGPGSGAAVNSLMLPTSQNIYPTRQHRLDLNQLLTTVNEVPGATPVFRPLTEHPVNVVASNPMGQSLNTIVPVTWNAFNRPSYPGQDVIQQEFWARYDRQRMARDIYTLLYTLCAGKNLDPAQVDNSSVNGMRPYLNDFELVEMAQFAVNVVDSLDRDDVITRFEYDRNLQNGWNLDDNAHTTDATVTDRGVVHGVERQSLTLSEFLAIRPRKVTRTVGNVTTAYDHPATAHDDTEDRVFAYIELRNCSPFDVPLIGGHWRIVIERNVTSPIPNEVRRLVLRANARIEGGTRLTIASCSDDHKAQSSASMFLVDPTYSGNPMGTANPQPIAPRTVVPGDFFDLVIQGGTPASGRPYRISDGNRVDKTDKLGSLLHGAADNIASGNFAAGTLNVRVILQRRAHRTRRTLDPLNIASNEPSQAQYDQDNPWIEVDRMVYVRPNETSVAPNPDTDWMFAIRDTDNNPASGDPQRIITELGGLRSRQRPNPLARGGDAYWPHPGGSATLLNSIGLDNPNSPNVFQEWQLHVDRDFASIGELLNIPVYGPADVTRLTNKAGTDSAGNLKFLKPSLGAQNRWHRLFEFVEVPSRLHRTLAAFYRYRHPGKINVNTIRDPEVLAALLDEIDALKPVQRRLVDQGGEGTSRDWWAQFVMARDRLDPITGMYLPGGPGSRPFRSFAFTAAGIRSIEHTLLRWLPFDSNVGNPDLRRRLFELGTAGQHNNNSIHHAVRHQLLSKILGNTTNRSHVFFVFVKVQWYEAHVNPANGHTRIGARATDVPARRGFYVIDRSRALENLVPEKLPASTYSFASPVSRKIDSSHLILYRRVIE